jgi:hypothetical protein
MTEAEECRRKSEGYLARAAKARNPVEKGKLLTAAAYWNDQAQEAERNERERRKKR